VVILAHGIMAPLVCFGLAGTEPASNRLPKGCGVLMNRLGENFKRETSGSLKIERPGSMLP